MISDPGADSRTQLPLSVAGGLVATALILFETSAYGPGVTPDSIDYVRSAERILAGQLPLTGWHPPLYSLVLALSGLLHADLLLNARVLNALFTGAAVCVAASWLLRRAATPLLPALGLCTMALSGTLRFVSVYLWSEPLFILLTVTAIVLLESWWRNPNRSLPVVAALTCAAALLTRHMGLALMGTGVLLLLLRPGRPGLRRLLGGALFAALALTPSVLWALVTYFSTGTLTGQRVSVPTDLAPILLVISQVGFQWTLPHWPLLPAATWVMGAVVLLLIGAVALALLNRRQDPTALPLSATWVFPPLYLLTLLAAALLTNLDPPEIMFYMRYLSPLYLPLAMLVILGLDHGLQQLMTRLQKQRVRIWGLILALLWTAHTARIELRTVAWRHREGAGGYASAAYLKTELASVVRRMKLNPKRVISNEPPLVYLLSGRHVLMAPRQHVYAAQEHQTRDLKQLRNLLQKERQLTLIWFDRGFMMYLVPLSQLGNYFRLTPLRRVGGGAIYRLEQYRYAR